MTLETKAQETLWKRECVDSERRGRAREAAVILCPLEMTRCHHPRNLKILLPKLDLISDSINRDVNTEGGGYHRVLPL